MWNIVSAYGKHIILPRILDSYVSYSANLLPDLLQKTSMADNN